MIFALVTEREYTGYILWAVATLVMAAPVVIFLAADAIAGFRRRRG